MRKELKENMFSKYPYTKHKDLKMITAPPEPPSPAPPKETVKVEKNRGAAHGVRILLHIEVG